MPPIARFNQVDIVVLNGIKAQISGQILFVYAANDFKIRTSSAADQQSVARYLDGRDTEFYKSNPSSPCG